MNRKEFAQRVMLAGTVLAFTAPRSTNDFYPPPVPLPRPSLSESLQETTAWPYCVSAGYLKQIYNTTEFEKRRILGEVTDAICISSERLDNAERELSLLLKQLVRNDTTGIVSFCETLDLFDKNFFPKGVTPLPGKISTYFSRAHPGIDVAQKQTLPIKNVLDGRVVHTGFQEDGYGNYVITRYQNQLLTLYAHLSQIDVEIGEPILQGQQIGLVGSTGRSSANHLHFEIMMNTQSGCRYVNPLLLIP